MFSSPIEVLQSAVLARETGAIVRRLRALDTASLKAEIEKTESLVARMAGTLPPACVRLNAQRMHETKLILFLAEQLRECEMPRPEVERLEKEVETALSAKEAARQ